MKSKINKKLYFNILFYCMGTFMIFIFGTIVMLNFFRDARLFGANAQEVTEVSVPSDKLFEQADANKIVKYKRAVDPVVEKKKDAEEKDEDKEKKKQNEDLQKFNGIKVQVINYTEFEGLSGDVKTTLEASGFTVTAVEKGHDPNFKTSIVDTTGNDIGAAVKAILKSGEVMKASNPNAAFGIIIILGSDFNP